MNDSFSKGKEYLEGGCLEGAIAELEFAILNNKYLWDAYYYLAKAYFQQAISDGDDKLLIRSYHTIQSLESLNPDYNRNDVQKLKKKIEKAFLQFGIKVADEAAIAEEAIASDPHEVLSHNKISRSLKEGPATRIIRFEKIIEADPANILALSQLGQAYEEMESKKRAQEVYERLIKHAVGLDAATGLYESEENLTAAVRWWADQISSHSEMQRESIELMKAFYRLGRILHKQGELAGATLMYSGAIDLAINLNTLLSLKHIFNEFLACAIQAGQFTLAQERFPMIKKVLEEAGEEDVLDPLLVSLIHSRKSEDGNSDPPF